MNTFTFTKNGIKFEVDISELRYGKLDVVATNSDGARAFGGIPGYSLRRFPRVEFSKYNQLRIGGKAGFKHTPWLLEAADKKYHHLGDFETPEEAELRPYDSITFELDEGTINLINELWIGSMSPVVTTEEIQAEGTPPIAGYDFSHSGLGIGGINNDQSLPEIPSAQALERVQRMTDTDVICRCCGASKNFDGAMFTTGGGNICDDCF